MRYLKTGKDKKKQKLELVHSDVWGPAQVTSINGCRPTQVTSINGCNYYVTFIDDATCKTWIYCIRNKSNVFDTF